MRIIDREGITVKFKSTKPQEISGNIFEAVGEKWMLITGGDKAGFNTMTASWGGAGILWQRPVTFCFVRPQRFTRGFMDAGDYFTLSFYGEEYRPQLNIAGIDSGRDGDKVAKMGFTPAFADCGAAYFEEAELVLVCKKIYFDDFKPENFLAPDIDKMYKDGDYHRMYIGEIIEVLKKD